MKAVLFGFLLAGVVAGAGCVGMWEHGAAWEAQTSDAPRTSPYMPTIHDEKRLREAQHRSWVEVHLPKTGLVGYLMTEISGLYDIGGPEKLYYVFDRELHRIGFFTKLGSTYRYVFDDYRQSKKFIGHYEAKEGIAHLLKVPVKVELKPLSVKPPRY